jgi:hypothetical protein
MSTCVSEITSATSLLKDSRPEEYSLRSNTTTNKLDVPGFSREVFLQRYERFLHGIRIGRSSRSFPPSKPLRRVSPQAAFQYSDQHSYALLGVSRWIRHNLKTHTSESTAQPVAWSPPLCRRTRLHYSFRHVLSLVHPFLLSSGSFRLSDLHHVLPITERRWLTQPPLPALPPAGILAALTSTGGVSVP